MEAFEQPQPPQDQYASNPPTTPVAAIIVPCAVVGVDCRGGNVSGAFHLLSCGHTVVVYEGDKRCGRNCQHAAAWVASVQADETACDTAAQAPCTVCPPLTTTQSFDLLYCEVCQGIPVDRYKSLTMIEEPSILRRALALTRPVMQSMLGLDHLQAHALLNSPLFIPNDRTFNWRYVHQLLCGHEVYALGRANRGYNCGHGGGCTSALALNGGQNSDSIACQECVTRAELVYQRFARFQIPSSQSVDSGYVIAGI